MKSFLDVIQTPLFESTKKFGLIRGKNLDELIHFAYHSKILLFPAWEENPTITGIESITSPIEDLNFPAVTLCPKNPNPGRWGPVIKLFDHVRRRCNHIK